MSEFDRFCSSAGLRRRLSAGSCRRQYRHRISRLMCAVATGAAAIAIAEPAASYEHTSQCIGTAISIASSSQSEFDRICRAAQTGVELFQQCGMHLPRKVVIDTIDGDLLSAQRRVRGLSVPETGRIRIVGEAHARRLHASEPAYLKLDFSSYYTGVVVHELAHIALAHRIGHLDLPLGAHEYVAYAFQFASFSELGRRAVLEQFAAPASHGLQVFS